MLPPRASPASLLRSHVAFRNIHPISNEPLSLHRLRNIVSRPTGNPDGLPLSLPSPRFLVCTGLLVYGCGVFILILGVCHRGCNIPWDWGDNRWSIGHVCGPLGVAAWIMGRSDLKSIDAGVMDPTGRGLTMAGMVCGIIASILLIISLCFVVLWFLFIIVAVGSGGMGP